MQKVQGGKVQRYTQSFFEDFYAVKNAFIGLFMLVCFVFFVLQLFFFWCAAGAKVQNDRINIFSEKGMNIPIFF